MDRLVSFFYIIIVRANKAAAADPASVLLVVLFAFEFLVVFADLPSIDHRFTGRVALPSTRIYDRNGRLHQFCRRAGVIMPCRFRNPAELHVKAVTCH